MQQCNVLIIGASVSGLACAACLQKKGIDYIIIEKEQRIASPWHNHYDRLHLHTSKRFSHLPYKKFDKSIPYYPGRQQVINYLDSYADSFSIRPAFNTEALAIKKEMDYWITETNNTSYKSAYIILATGSYNTPRSFQFKGQETFTGIMLHSSQYKNGSSFTGQKALVVGFGNSACEIAIDLYEQGADVSMSVRSPVNIIPRDILGVNVIAISLLLSRLSPRLADTVSKPFIQLLTGNFSGLGLKKLPYGPVEQICKYGRAPVIDIGIVKQLKKGHININSSIDLIDGSNVYFENGNRDNFDVIIAAIGYNSNYNMVALNQKRFDDILLPPQQQRYFGEDGLYFCGQYISPYGQIREIGIEAKKIAASISPKN